MANDSGVSAEYKENPTTDSRLTWGTEHVQAETFLSQQVAIMEAAVAAKEAALQNPDLNEEARKRITSEAEAEAGRKLAELQQNEAQAFQQWEEEATRQAKPPKAMQSETFLLGQQNGLLMLNLMQGGASLTDLRKELESVAERNLPGEVFAWAKTLPHIAKQKKAVLKFTDQAFYEGGKIEDRCAELLEAIKPDGQKRGEANLQFLKEQKDRLTKERNFARDQGGNTLEGRLKWLRLRRTRA